MAPVHSFNSAPPGMAVGTAQDLIPPWLYLIHSLNINSRYQHQAKGLEGYVYTVKWRRALGLSMAPRWMAMRDWESSFFLACGEIELSIFGRAAGGTNAWRCPDGLPWRLFTKSTVWMWERHVCPHCLAAGCCSMASWNGFGISGSYSFCLCLKLLWSPDFPLGMC